MRGALSREAFANLRIPNLTTVLFDLPVRGVKSGGGKPVNPKQVIEDFARDLRTVFDATRTNEPHKSLPAEFVVPDLWHMTHGDACIMGKQNGERLWDACIMATDLGRTFYGIEAMESRNNHPGSVFREPLAEPRWAELETA